MLMFERAIGNFERWEDYGRIKIATGTPMRSILIHKDPITKLHNFAHLRFPGKSIILALIGF